MTLLLSNGNLVDGTGSAAYRGDILIAGDRIAAMGPNLEVCPERVVDCTGLTVAPGFIDAHSHSDLQVLENRTEKRMQGVTAEVVGNCGFSAFPSGPDDAAVREYTNSILHGGTSWAWPNARSYLEDVERLSQSGVLTLTGHGTLRTAFAGTRQGALEPAVLDRMAAALDECLAGGSAGFSTGLMYAPGSSASREELQRLCSV